MENLLDQFIADYQNAIAEEPENAPAYSEVAEFYYDRGQFKEALEACQKALEIQPDLASASLLLDKVLQALLHRESDRPNSRLVFDNWIYLDARSLGNYPDGISQLYNGEIAGMAIAQVFSKSEMATVLQKIRENGERQIPMPFGSLMGIPIVGTEADKTEYFQDATIFRNDLDNLFAMGFETRVEMILSQLSGGRPVEVAKKTSAQTYVPATLRILHPHQGGLGAHTGNAFIEADDSHAELKPIAKLTNSLSYFIVIDTPEAGGELVVYDLLWERTPPEIKELYTNYRMNPILEKFGKIYVKPDIGDMILFNGGQIWHRVADIEGKKNRLTVGGFVTLSKDDRQVLYWS